MTRHMVVGTAGHVDHGKTALVKALSGIDTDRWEEEKRRGITIDIGFARLALSDGLEASIVDVPGHEDFVRNMVAGATGVDVALLVVAADEGVMPQTREHLAILEFLRVKSGVVAVTKSDLAEPDWMELVESEIGERLADSTIDWLPPVRVSTVTESGVDDVRAALAAACDRAEERSKHGLFRLPVDRVFSVAGAGTVVTGTTWSGSVRVGDEVRVLPGDLRARVRNVEVHGQSAVEALPGRRTALALAGLYRGDIARGHVVVQDDTWRETRSIDVIVTLLPDSRPFTQRTRVRFHLGTAEVMARVTPEGEAIAPGTSGGARLRLERPIVCRWGDLGVLRSYSPVTTVGGCVVVDPWPAARPRRPVNLAERASSDPAARLVSFVEGAGTRAVPVSDLPIRIGVPAASLVQLLAVAGDRVISVDNRLIAPRIVIGARDATLTAVREYHNKQPLEPGMPRELARRAVRDVKLANFVQDQLVAEGALALEGETVRLTSHHAGLSREQEAVGKELQQELTAAGPLGKTLAELGAKTNSETRQVVEFFVRQGTAVRVGSDRYYDRGVLDRLSGEILREVQRAGEALPAQLREKTGLSRKYLIPLLEWMDTRSLTVRVGDGRRIGPAGEKVLAELDRE